MEIIKENTLYGRQFDKQNNFKQFILSFILFSTKKNIFILAKILLFNNNKV